MTNKRTEFISTRRSTGSSKAWARNQNLTAYAPSVKLGPIAHAVLVVVMLALLGLLYLTQLTKTSSFSYEMNDIETKRAELVAERDDLKVENARLQALSRVKDSSVAAAMTAPTSTDYAAE